MTAQQYARIDVTLLHSDNTYLDYPVEGQLVINEVGTLGAIISASFRKADGTKVGGLAALVEVKNPVFIYGKMPGTATDLKVTPHGYGAWMAETSEGERYKIRDEGFRGLYVDRIDGPMIVAPVSTNAVEIQPRPRS